MKRKVEERIARLAALGDAGILAGGLKGIEKESLRVRPDGQLADTPHSQALGSAGIRVNTISPGPIFFKGGVWEWLPNGTNRPWRQGK